MTLTLRELFQLNPVLTILGIVIIAAALWRIVRGKQGTNAANKSGTAIEAGAQRAAAVPEGDIIAAITAAVTEHRKKEL